MNKFYLWFAKLISKYNKSKMVIVIRGDTISTFRDGECTGCHKNQGGSSRGRRSEHIEFWGNDLDYISKEYLDEVLSPFLVSNIKTIPLKRNKEIYMVGTKQCDTAHLKYIHLKK